jgi:hypothetical protein
MTEYRSKRNGQHYPLKGGKRSYPEEKWIHKATKGHKKGALHEQLDVPIDEKIPETLEKKIVDAPIGSTIENPTETGKKKIKITKCLKQRANFALNVRPE